MKLQIGLTQCLVMVLFWKSLEQMYRRCIHAVAARPLQFMIYVGFGLSWRRWLRVRFDAVAAEQTQMVDDISGIAVLKARSGEVPMLARLDQTLFADLQAGYRVGTPNIRQFEVRDMIFRFAALCSPL